MFLDEPTSNLDLYHELKLLKILKNESKKGKGYIVDNTQSKSSF